MTFFLYIFCSLPLPSLSASYSRPVYISLLTSSLISFFFYFTVTEWPLFSLLKSGKWSPFTFLTSQKQNSPTELTLNLWVTPDWFFFSSESGLLIRKKEKKFPAPDGESRWNCVITAQLRRLLWDPGRLAGKALLCCGNWPYKQAGFIASPLASACLRMEANDH